MIPSREETKRALAGAVALARNDAAAQYLFNLTPDGFRNSFAAPLAMAPVNLLIVAVQNGASPLLGALLLSKLVAILAFIALWPLLMLALTRGFEREGAYLGYIVAYNWAVVPVVAFALPAAALSAMGGALGQIGAILGLLVFLASLAYLWMIARQALDARPLLATAIVALDLLLTFALEAAVGRLFF